MKISEAGEKKKMNERSKKKKTEKKEKKLGISFRERHYKVRVKYIEGRVGGSKDGEMGTG